MIETHTTASDVVTAAMDLARDVADGRLAPADIEQRAVAELRAIVGDVVGPGDPVWELQVDVARGVLAAAGIPADELAEWTAVARRRGGEPSIEPDPVETVAEPVSPVSDEHSPIPDDTEPITEPSLDVEVRTAPVSEPAPVVTLLRRAGENGGYDPLAGWNAGSSRRS